MDTLMKPIFIVVGGNFGLKCEPETDRYMYFSIYWNE